MFTKTFLPGLVAALVSTASLAQTNAPAVADYSWLAASTLPQPGPMLDAALANLPKSIREKSDWLARMKKAAWVPTLEFRHTIGQGGFRQFETVDRQTVSSSSETTRESESSKTTTTDISPVPGSSTDSGKGSRSSTTRGTTTTDEGRTSYARDDEARWLHDYGVYLSWDLSRLVFRSEELNVLSAEMSKETFRDNVRTQVITTYYDLKESLLLLENENFKDSVQIKVKKERLAFLLDTITGGELTTRGQPKK